MEPMPQQPTPKQPDQLPVPQKHWKGAGWFTAAWMKFLSSDESVAASICNRLMANSMDAETLRWFSPKQLQLAEKEILAYSLDDQTRVKSIFKNTILLATDKEHKNTKIDVLVDIYTHLAKEKKIELPPIDLSLPDDPKALYDVFRPFIENGDTKKIVEVVKAVDKKFIKNNLSSFEMDGSSRSSLEQCIRECNLSDVMEIIEKIPNYSEPQKTALFNSVRSAITEKTDILWSASKELREKGNTKGAIEIVGLMSWQKTDAMDEIIENCPINDLIQCIKEIPDQPYKEHFVCRICSRFAFDGVEGVTKALNANNEIPLKDTKNKQEALLFISCGLCELSLVDKAIKMTNQIPDFDIPLENRNISQDSLGDSFDAVFEKLLANKKPEEGIQLALLLSNENFKGARILQIFDKLIKSSDDIPAAERLINKTSEPNKSFALRAIANIAFKRNKDVGEMMKIVGKIDDPRVKNLALADIAIFSKRKDIANRITDEEIKAAALARIG